MLRSRAWHLSYRQLREVTAFLVVDDKLSRGCSSSIPRRSVLTNLPTYGIIGIPALGLADIAIDRG